MIKKFSMHKSKYLIHNFQEFVDFFWIFVIFLN